MPVPDLERGIAFFAGQLGHAVLWRNEPLGQAGLALPDSDTELVLTTRLDHEPNWLVTDVDDALARFRAAGGQVVAAPSDIPVGRVAVAQDPFGNRFVLVELRGRYVTGADGDVTDVG